MTRLVKSCLGLKLGASKAQITPECPMLGEEQKSLVRSRQDRS